MDEVFETTAPNDWALKDICILIIRARCFGAVGDERLLDALQPVFCKHSSLVEKTQLCPELEDKYFNEGRLYSLKCESEECVDGAQSESSTPSVPSDEVDSSKADVRGVDEDRDL